MEKVKLFDIVSLNRDINRFSLRKGMIATVLHIYNNLYELEFITQEGLTLECCPVEKEAVEKVFSEETGLIREQTIFIK